MSDADVPTGHLVFACGERLYALPADVAAEVVTHGELAQVPGAPRHVRGVFAHRGEALTIVDLGLIFHGAPAETQRVVVMRVPGGAVGLTTTQVQGISSLPGGLPALAPSGAEAHLRGPVRTDAHDVDVVVIDPQGFFTYLSQRADVSPPP